VKYYGQDIVHLLTESVTEYMEYSVVFVNKSYFSVSNIVFPTVFLFVTFCVVT
jgi:hypothetical protein